MLTPAKANLPCTGDAKRSTQQQKLFHMSISICSCNEERLRHAMYFAPSMSGVGACPATTSWTQNLQSAH